MKILSLIIMMTSVLQGVCQMNFKSERITRTASFEIDGSVESVFPLFGPIREKEWAEGWDPEVIFGSPNQIGEHFIFRTSASTDERTYLWVITQFRPDEHLIEYTVSTSNRIWFIRVSCRSTTQGKTLATVSYTYTGLNEKGNALNKIALEKIFSENLDDWKQAINYYIHHNKIYTSTHKTH